MKEDIFKMVGVKNAKEFYSKFSNDAKGEAAFMAKYGKQIKKLQLGSSMPNNKPAKVGSFTGNEKSIYNPINYGDVYDDVDYSVTGSNRQMRMDQANLASQQEIAQNSKKKNGLFDMLGQLAPALNSLSGEEGAVDLSSIDMRYGGRLRKAENGFNQGVINFGKKVETFGQKVGQGYDKVDSGLGKIGGVAGGLGAIGDITQGIQMTNAEKDQKNLAKQSFGLSEVTRQASQSLPEITNRNYLRPEDQITYADQFNKPGGVGTNVLAVNGARINSGEIQNIYNPGNIYSDLEDEPLNSKGKSKYKKGGKIEKAQLGIDKMAGQAGNQLGSLIFGGKGQPTGAGQVGSTIGSTVGKFIPIPGASAVLGGVGGFIGSAFGVENLKGIANYQEGADRNLAGQAFEQGARGMLNQNSQFAKYGASVSDDIQPQFIKQFGDYTMNQLLQPDPMMNTLRSGGNLREYTPPSNRALQTYEDGGEVTTSALNGNIKTLWGGGVKELGYNPHMPGTGKTFGFIGNDHDKSDGKGNTGIGMQYGQGNENSYMASAKNGAEKQNSNIVEVENEPAAEFIDPKTGNKQLTVFGALPVNHEWLGDKDAKGENYTKYIEKLTKKEPPLNKLVDKSIIEIGQQNLDTSIDKITRASFEANIKGANMKLKDIATKKTNAASLQSAIHDTKEKYGIAEKDLHKLAMGKIDNLSKASDQQARFGKNITKAQFGETISDEDYAKAMQLYDQGDTKGFQQLGMKLAPDYVKSLGVPTISKKFDDGISGYRTEDLKKYLTSQKSKGQISPQNIAGLEKIAAGIPGVSYGDIESQISSSMSALEPSMRESADVNPEVAPRNRDWIMSAMNQILPYVRPSDAEALDPNQLIGERYALATNQLEPVQTQTFQPQLGTPYDISLQDQLNANQSDYRALQRMTGYNPAAQAILNSQKYLANQQVLGEQFRGNQAMRDKVYGENRQLLNEANLKNLAIYDQQYDRQTAALATTKAITQAALNSMASKFAQNKLENRTAQIYENLYNFRYDNKGRAINMNPLAQFNMQGSGSPDLSNMSSDQIKQLSEIKKMEELEAKKAKEVASKTSRNGSIVKSYKNL